MSGTQIYSYIYQVLNALMSVGIVLVVGVMFLFFLRMKNARDVEPDKKTGERKIMVEFYTEGGDHYYELCRYKGNEVISKNGGSYFISSECIYNSRWKPGQPSMIQVGVGCTSYYENKRTPIISKKPNLWIENPNEKQITAYMQRTALNESTLKAMIAMSEKVWADIAQMAQFIKNVPYVFYGMLAVLGLLGVTIYMIYMLMSQVSYLRSLFG